MMLAANISDCPLPKFWLPLLVFLTSLYGPYADASLPLVPPTATVFVKVHGHAAPLVMKRLKLIAAQNGIRCDVGDVGNLPGASCYLGDSYKLILIASTDEAGTLVTINLHLEDESFRVDEALRAKMNVFLKRYAIDLKGRHHIEAVRRCNRGTLVLSVESLCESEDLL
jgi:hypothetical protein